jgi:dienelactone hydrolase
MSRHWLRAAVVVLLAVGPAVAEPLPGFRLDGSKWTYKDDKVEMHGVFAKPDGDGPFPAVLISHGRGGNAENFGGNKAREMVKWGFVCIAPNYTHAGNAPGGPKDFGACEENLCRAEKCLDILASLPYVDGKRLVAYGHSMGGFVTIGLAGRVPGRLTAAAITGSGIAPAEGYAAPSAATAEKIRTPFLILHGSKDPAVRPEQSANLKAILDKSKVANERQVFEGEGHPIDQTKKAEVYDALKAWFTKLRALKAKEPG